MKDRRKAGKYLAAIADTFKFSSCRTDKAAIVYPVPGQFSGGCIKQLKMSPPKKGLDGLSRIWSRRRKMKETNDLVTKNFESFPDVAADIINVLMYQGKRLVREEHLVPAPTESIYQGREGLRNQYEDLGKYELNDGKINALYLFANQTRTDGGMLLRKAGYVGAAYREQYDGKIRDVCPVVEIVLYWGRGKWKGRRTMRRLFGEKKLPPEIWRYIDDLKLHVCEMRRLPPEKRKLFTSDMRIVVDYLAEGNTYRSEQKVVHKEALIKMLRVLSGDRYVENTAFVLKEMKIGEEDEITVCELFDQYIRLGKNEGRKEGLKEGKRRGVIEGREKGKREGMKEGKKEGIKEGLKAGIAALIITCKEYNANFEETAEKLKLRFHLSDQEVRENMTLYW